MCKYKIIFAILVISGLFLSTDTTYASITKDNLKPISKIVNQEIRKGKIPGAVIMIGTHNKILYHQAFGWRSIKPVKTQMTKDTIFDLASLTKVIATTTAIMKLYEEGKIKIDDKVSTYIPEFSKNGKSDITIRHLLTHYSGLKPDLPLNTEWNGYNTAIKMATDDSVVDMPGSKYIYSDINFVILGEIIKKVTGKPFHIYCKENIFEPLGMKNTFFEPDILDKKNIAPTQIFKGKSGKVLCGEVHDPTARRMGGVAGHAGLFSTSEDISKFAMMLLSDGLYNKNRFFEKSTIEIMTSPQSPEGKTPFRGLGWALDAPFASNREDFSPVGSYGHKGYTGTLLWIDPISDIFVIILTNRVHPDGKGDAEPLRKKIIELISCVSGNISNEIIFNKRPVLKKLQLEEIINTTHSFKNIHTGIDVLRDNNFKDLSGLRIGLITNHTGKDSNGIRTIDLLANAPDVKLIAIFSPEHGLDGNSESLINSSIDSKTGLTVYSLYGDTLKPDSNMLNGIDALVFDIQDAGVRFYTYITTMAYAMEEAAKKGIIFYVLDRPNPINSITIQGPLLDKDLKSFTGYFPLPIRYGMTVGELAEMFNKENDIGVKLRVIKMKGYKRSYWFDDTRIKWIPASPNLKTLNETILYPGVALLEGANISVGRGTETPFEIIGTPWIKEKKLTSFLTKRKINGIKFKPVIFRPKKDIYKNKLCRGVKILLEDRNTLDPVLLGMELISAIYILHGDKFQIDKTLQIIGSRETVKNLKNKVDPKLIAMKWKDDIENFKKIRAKYLLY